MCVLRLERAFYIGRARDKEMPFKVCKWLDKVNKGEGKYLSAAWIECVRALDMVIKNSSFLYTKSVLLLVFKLTKRSVLKFCCHLFKEFL